MSRKGLWGWVGIAALAPTILTSAVWASSAGPAQDNDIHSTDGPPTLDCGGGLALAYHGDYTPKNKDQQKASPAAKSPDEAVNRLLTKVYPGAARERAFARVPGHAQARFEAANGQGGRQAVLVIGEQEGQYYVQDVAMCADLATRWAR